MPGGRPLKFKSVEELETKIQAYFDACDPHIEEVKDIVWDKTAKTYDEIFVKRMSRQIPYTITGLAVALDTSRETLLNYEDREEFFDTIKRAKEKIHAFVEARLFENNATGPIFNLKNNFGWRDKTETEVTGGDNPVRMLLEKYGLLEGENNAAKSDEPIQDSRDSSTQA
jgi:hypothetical protein